ncbi:Fur family transcriptional regulator [Lihuaxuella thermophila]|uniref:Fur family transcriptional regulator, zinc uptake regulator n=1 Tax=Lihuaxuella thermophila TaxID=1173111 RepID=A0A1H8BPZ0_9BACL|nr:Fur family transcriptional regulator [Lihuaxuella thermophila]SEM84863.1 Fur family transcriptional regulator, zinc uptake regulator [Lihuaxuella thermophila]
MDLKQALDLLKKNGYKYTGKRERMVHIFSEQGRYLTAKEVLDYMQKDYPGLSFDTVYRNLALFEDLGIIEGTEWDGERRYRFNCGGNSHHHHLICTECGRTRTIHVCPMNAILGKPDNFEITGHKFEIYGRCSECMESSSVSPSH